ncbi:MAG: cobyrinate a,c-diamide synthase [Pseudomonadota bacterium]
MTPPACPRLVVAAVRGGGGKTTVALGLISVWRKQGLRVIPFKKGPDYIDAGWLAQAAGEPCFNLDPFLMTQEQIRRSFAFRTAGRLDCAVIEGNRGLYDGTDVTGTYSTAELAKLLQAPVVLVVDCYKVTRTLAAVVLGLRQFDPDLNLAAVILNNVATSRQESLVRRAVEEQAGLPVLGAVPRSDHPDLPERHLGLVPHQEHPAAQRALQLLTKLVGENVDLDRLLELAGRAPGLGPPPESLWSLPDPKPRPRVRIGVMQDSVFQFYYPENLEALERLGAEVIVFSSFEARRLPDLDALYLGGGFPETQAEVLADNHGLRDDIHRAAQKGFPIYAECGGLMYLGRELVLEGRSYPMTGVFPVAFSLEKHPQGHGYTVVSADRPNPYFRPGERLVGHEFHYSRPLYYEPSEVRLALTVERGQGFDGRRDGLTVNNVLAMYTHLHALGTTRWAEALVDLAAAFRLLREKDTQEGPCP